MAKKIALGESLLSDIDGLAIMGGLIPMQVNIRPCLNPQPTAKGWQ